MKYILPIFLVISQVLFAQIPSYVPVAGLQCYYPFNGNGNDAGSLNNHLTNNGAVLTTDRLATQMLPITSTEAHNTSSAIHPVLLLIRVQHLRSHCGTTAIRVQ